MLIPDRCESDHECSLSLHPALGLHQVLRNSRFICAPGGGLLFLQHYFPDMCILTIAFLSPASGPRFCCLLKTWPPG